MKKFLKFLMIIICATVLFFGASSVLAANEATKTVNLTNPLSQNLSPAQTIGLFIKVALGVVGGLTLVMVVYGGFVWLTAAGNKEKIDMGSKTMLWAVIGLILVLGSYLLVNTIVGFLANR